jgi:hypothetical protein
LERPEVNGDTGQDSRCRDKRDSDRARHTIAEQFDWDKDFWKRQGADMRRLSMRRVWARKEICQGSSRKPLNSKGLGCSPGIEMLDRLGALFCHSAIRDKVVKRQSRAGGKQEQSDWVLTSWHSGVLYELFTP